MLNLLENHCRGKQAFPAGSYELTRARMKQDPQGGRPKKEPLAGICRVAEGAWIVNRGTRANLSWTTEGAFREFFLAINLPGDHRTIANNRKDWIVGRLRNGGLNVLDAFTMGSIPRYTALRDHADLDVMVVLHFTEHIKGRTPAQVLSTVKSSLGSGAGNVRRNGQAVTMKFVSWPNVDVVPASREVDEARVVTGYSIPDMNRGKWISTNPPGHSQAMTSAVTLYGSNFRHVIKMMKEWNRRQAVPMQSYHIEVIALKMATGCDDYSWATKRWFETAKNNVNFCWHANADVAAYLSWERKQRVIAQLQAASTMANSAWYSAYSKNHQQAISQWRTLFGQKFPTYG